MNVLVIIKKLLPNSIWNLGASIYRKFLAFKYLKGKRPIIKAETYKAKNRRIKEDFFSKYCKGSGLDIGFGGDLVLPEAVGWDFEHGDAQYLKGIADESYDYVYSSHTLEHVDDAKISLINWFRVLKKGGYLILYIPHRDLYEKKKSLPSRFNATHKRFFLIDEHDPPDTLGIVPLIKETLNNIEIIYAKKCDEGFTITDPMIHSDGEYSIEIVVRKK